MKTVVSLVRTLKVAVEARLNLSKPMPCHHAIVHWLFEHAAWILSKYAVDGEGRTPYGRRHGHEAQVRVCEFGERVMFYIPSKGRAKLDVRWTHGTFIWRSHGFRPEHP